MSCEVSYTRSAAQAIRRLDPGLRTRIRAAADALAADPTRGKLLHLSLQGLRSWRTADWRIAYRIEHDVLEILIVTVGHRRDVYDRLRQRLR